MSLFDGLLRNSKPGAGPVADARQTTVASTSDARGRGGSLLIAGAVLALAVVAWLRFRSADSPLALTRRSGGAAAGSSSSPLGGIVSWVAKKFATMRELGISGTIERLIIRIENGVFFVQDHWFDFVHGTDTAQVVHLDELDIRSENVERGGRYAPTAARSFKSLLQSLDLPPGSVFVDIGSGKGKTLLLASEYGFKRVVGVEFAGELNEQARRNWSIYRRGRDNSPDFEVVTIDAAEYEIKDDENVFFLFNPFDDVVMNTFIRNIDASLERAPRTMWIIYQNPVNQDVFERHGGFRMVKRFGQRGDAFAIYRR